MAKRKRSKRKSSGPQGRRESQGAGRSGLWLYGVHTALAALANHERQIERLVLTDDAGRTLAGRLEKIAAARARDGARPLP